MRPILSLSDLAMVQGILLGLSAQQRQATEIVQLEAELAKANVVADNELDPEVIRIGSYCEVEEVTSKQRLCLTLVLPDAADIKQGRWSILSPLGVALIGFQQGMTITWKMPGGIRRFLIAKVSQATSSVVQA
jgi:regulator of nucleoside diphosphate kinase